MIVWFNKTKKTQSFMIILCSQVQMWDELDVVTIFFAAEAKVQAFTNCNFQTRDFVHAKILLGASPCT